MGGPNPHTRFVSSINVAMRGAKEKYLSIVKLKRCLKSFVGDPSAVYRCDCRGWLSELIPQRAKHVAPAQPAPGANVRL